MRQGNMRIFVMGILCLALMSGGCAWFGGSSDDASAAPTATSMSEEETALEKTPEPAVTAPEKKSKKDAKAKKSEKAAKHSKKSEAQIAAELDAVGRRLATQASRTIVPSKTSKKVAQHGKEYVATYIDVDPAQASMELRPGAKGYVGIIRYQEKTMECRGATKQAALAGTNCKQVKTKGVKELIHYDGNAWQY